MKNIATVKSIIEQAVSQTAIQRSPTEGSHLEHYLRAGQDSFFLGTQLTSYTLCDFIFPEENDESYSQVLKIISLLKNVTFSECEFNSKEFYFLEPNQRHSGLHFHQCIFKDSFLANYHVVHSDYEGGIFSECIFEKEIVINGGVYDGDVFNEEECTVFYNCIFKNDLTLSGIRNRTNVFYNNKENSASFILNKISIKYSSFESRFVLEGYKINKLEVKDTVFEGKVNFKNNSIVDLDIYNSNFNAVVDFHSSDFSELKMHTCIFSGFVGFEKCIFKDSAIFVYVTFNSFTSFRSATFESRLSFEHTNMMSLPNFFNCTFTEQAKKKTDRETFRIIKNSFDAVGNFVEGNRFYANEMYAYERELSGKKGKRAEKVLLYLNKKFSGFGQSYLYSVAWLVVLCGVFALLVYGHNQGFLYRLLPSDGRWVHGFSTFFNSWASALIIFKPIMVEGMELLSLLFGIVFSALIWLTITSIKRHTRR